jgi:hypothetical protein
MVGAKMQNKVVLRISKSKFDAIWAVMIVIGGASLIVGSNPVAALPWLAHALLWTALATGLVLTIFIERAPVTTGERKPASMVSQLKAHSVAKTSANAETYALVSAKKGERAEEATRRPATVLSEALKHWRSVDLDASSRLCEKWQAEITIDTRRVFEIYTAKPTMPRSRDLVNEAVEIARRLQGTSLEVRLCHHGDIVISESSTSRTGDFDFSYGLRGKAKTEGSLLN